MYTPDELFFKEFKALLNNRLARYGNNKYFYLPNLKVCDLDLKKAKSYVYMEDIEEPFYLNLNYREDREESSEYYNEDLIMRYVDRTGQYMKDDKGQVLTKKIILPKDCVAIKTNINIKLRNTYEVDGQVEKYIGKKEYQYVDYTTEGGKKYYIYVVPKEKVKEKNLVALIITTEPKHKYYQGYKVVLQNGVWIYLYVLPYSDNMRNKYANSNKVRLLGVTTQTDMKQSINKLLNFWEKNAIIFPRSATYLTTGYKGLSNCSFRQLRAETLDSATYNIKGT